MTEERGGVQRELFPKLEGGHEASTFRSRFNVRPAGKVSFSISYENLVFVGILFIMTFVLSFSLGVEKGKGRVTQVAFRDEPVPQGLAPAQDVIGEPAPKPAAVAQKTVSAAAVENKTETPVPVVPATEKSAFAAPAVKPREAGYTIQLITFAQQDSANKQVEQLKKDGYKPYLKTSGKYFVICEGDYPDSSTAKLTLAQFKKSKSYQDAFLKKLR
ncbi:MAG: SPOR domain-containing protein [Candidatus Omnitrophica bacterium]|nr:SPOR domain-containing protein [Candidatus Omnitrophota bacterium]